LTYIDECLISDISSHAAVSLMVHRVIGPLKRHGANRALH